MRNKKIIACIFAINSLLCMSQSLVYGGFASFSISESINANSGGSIVWQDSRTSCIMVQGGHVYGSTEMFNNSALFRETCKNVAPITGLDKILQFKKIYNDHIIYKLRKTRLTRSEIITKKKPFIIKKKVSIFLLIIFYYFKKLNNQDNYF